MCGACCAFRGYLARQTMKRIMADFEKSDLRKRTTEKFPREAIPHFAMGSWSVAGR